MAQTKEYRTHRPSGQPAHPLILLEGGEKAGKSYAAALFSGSKRISRTLWIEFGEVTAEEYGAVPGQNYELVEHDGSYPDLLGAIEWAHRVAAKALEAGEPPVMLVIDSMTAVWDLLKAWANNRARGSKKNRAILATDPNAEIDTTTNYWNDANDRHARIMRLLRTFPGIAVMIAAGKWVSVIGADGQPIPGKKDYRVEGQKMLGFQTAHWVRLSRGEPALLVGCRKVNGGLDQSLEAARVLPEDWSLEWLVFEWLGYDPHKAAPTNLVEPKPERTPEQIADEAMLPGSTPADLARLWAEMRSCKYDSVIVPNERAQDEQLGKLLSRIGTERKAQAPATQDQHKHMHALWREAGEFEDREERLKFTREIIGRPIESSAELTGAEADKVLAQVKRYIEQINQQAAAQTEMAGAA